MKVFKFGGASIKDAPAIRNMSKIIHSYSKDQLIVVVSAMGKSTNALEHIHQLACDKKEYSSYVSAFLDFHQQVIDELFDDPTLANQEIDRWSQYLYKILKAGANSSGEWYDAIVSVGELLSSRIVSCYLNQYGISTTWADARSLILTDSIHRAANVNWSRTSENIGQVTSTLPMGSVLLTQGYIAAAEDGKTTTLGREGSDFSGAIFTSCADAESLTVWKDVPGILNGDPKKIENPILFPELSYDEASEMTYYGAKVIHPRTVKPLANRNIPLYVRPFDYPDQAGTRIHQVAARSNIPVIIFKEDQCLLSFKSKDLSFVNEEGISTIFKTLHELSIDMNIMQNSAVSLSICIDYNEGKVRQLIKELEDEFVIRYNTGLELITIKKYTPEIISNYLPKKEALLEQKSRSNYRVLLSN